MEKGSGVGDGGVLDLTPTRRTSRVGAGQNVKRDLELAKQLEQTQRRGSTTPGKKKKKAATTSTQAAAKVTKLKKDRKVSLSHSRLFVCLSPLSFPSHKTHAIFDISTAISQLAVLRSLGLLRPLGSPYTWSPLDGQWYDPMQWMKK